LQARITAAASAVVDQRQQADVPAWRIRDAVLVSLASLMA
jgi:hypothetical protein